MVRIDSHLHVWSLGEGAPRWLEEAEGALHRTYSADLAAIEMGAAGFEGAVVVQADDTATETRLLLRAAETHSWILGLVVWVQLDDTRACRDQLEVLAGVGAVRGVRHLTHQDPRGGFLELPEVRASLRALPEYGLALEIPDAWPGQLEQAIGVARDNPGLNVVLDHLGKPPRGDADMASWEAAVRRFAALPNTWAKVSGLRRAGQPYTSAALRPVWDVALDSFGADRLMVGSDWPMNVAEGGYVPTVRVLESLVSTLSADEREAVMGGTATRVFSLEGRIVR